MAWIRVDKVLDALFPPRCLLCGQRTGGPGPACAGCLGDLPWLDTGPDGLPACPPFKEVRCALAYVYPVDRLIAAAKFGRQLNVARGLGQLLDWRMPRVTQPPDAVVPVPLHWRREADRGFNQAEEIARSVCLSRGWPLRADLCRRVRSTPEQSALGAGERRENLRGAFALLHRQDAGRLHHVMLVDDVLTTGATAATLAAEFRAAGVPQLSLWTVAWTPSSAQAVTLKV